MKAKIFMLIGAVALLGLPGCGNIDQSISSNNEESEQQSTVIDNLEENETVDTEVVDNSVNDTMYIYSVSEPLKDYDTVDELLRDAYALVKVKVLQANSDNVGNYIYTSYDMKVLDIVYGTIDTDGDIINVNMPGGTIQGDDAQAMISEVTEGKDAGDLSGIHQIVSDGNTDRLLTVGDEAYLFLMKESDTSFAVVGEYRGEMLLESGEVIFDSNVIGFTDGISTYGLDGGSVTESEFIEAINELIKDL